MQSLTLLVALYGDRFVSEQGRVIGDVTELYWWYLFASERATLITDSVTAEQLPQPLPRRTNIIDQGHLSSYALHEQFLIAQTTNQQPSLVIGSYDLCQEALCYDPDKILVARTNKPYATTKKGFLLPEDTRQTMQEYDLVSVDVHVRE